jgi:hypothetical protein
MSITGLPVIFHGQGKRFNITDASIMDMCAEKCRNRRILNHEHDIDVQGNVLNNPPAYEVSVGESIDPYFSRSRLAQMERRSLAMKPHFVKQPVSPAPTERSSVSYMAKLWRKLKSEAVCCTQSRWPRQFAECLRPPSHDCAATLAGVDPVARTGTLIRILLRTAFLTVRRCVRKDRAG